MKTFIFTFGLALGLAAAQPAIQPPQVGILADQAGELRPLLGFAGNLFFGDSLGGGVLSAASSGSYAFVKTDNSILVLNGGGDVIYSADAASGPALFSFRADGSPALAYAGSSLMVWQTDHLETIAFNDKGTAVALGEASVIVQREDGLWRLDISTADGSVQSQAALQQHSPILILNDGQIVSADTLDVGEPISNVAQIGRGWVAVNNKFSVRVTPGREYVSQLPEVE
jgi:hypothetical protein